jgi:predicted DNA-binding transcriptional regulator AlpA
MAKTDTAPTPRRRKRPPPPVPEGLREYLRRRELLAVVPLSMATIDALEKMGAFPARIVLTPTTRVVWRRREVEKFLEDRARNRAKPARSKAASAQQNAA